MDPKLVRESKTTKKYTKKDGTLVEKEYVQKYVVVDKEKKITKAKIIEKIKKATPNQLKQIDDILK